MQPFGTFTHAAGASTLAEVAVAPNNRGIRAARGGQWYPMTVRNIECRNPP